MYLSIHKMGFFAGSLQTSGQMVDSTHQLRGFLNLVMSASVSPFDRRFFMLVLSYPF